ncbi:MAG: hypothetical protein ACQEP8_00890 [Chlamydiota bacterium]
MDVRGFVGGKLAFASRVVLAAVGSTQGEDEDFIRRGESEGFWGMEGSGMSGGGVNRGCVEEISGGQGWGWSEYEFCTPYNRGVTGCII